jgi:isoleucyl-tRNA synthetase
VTLYLDAPLRERYADAAAELRFFFITTEVLVKPLDDRLAHAEKVTLEGAEAWVEASASTAGKCIRCWHHREDVGSHDDHPELCGRCVNNVEGDGEHRQWF